jgi:predicted N-acetyltransferase YhbS
MKELTVLRNAAPMEQPTLTLRAGNPDDARICGEICYRAFATIAERYGFPADFATADAAQELISRLLERSDIYSVVAEVDGQIVGSNFLWTETVVAGVGPLTVDPSSQNTHVGKHLMQAVLDRAGELGCASVRLVQSAYNNCALALYTKLGFEVREPLVSIQGQALGLQMPGYPIRLATADDLSECDRLCRSIYGFDRSPELRQAIDLGTATVVEYDTIVTRIITGYATSIGFGGHAVGESNEDLQALIGAATSITGQGFLLPTRNSQLLRWCLQQGLRIVQPMTLMSLGLYDRPAGAFLPSILF